MSQDKEHETKHPAETESAELAEEVVGEEKVEETSASTEEDLLSCEEEVSDEDASAFFATWRKRHEEYLKKAAEQDRKSVV